MIRGGTGHSLSETGGAGLLDGFAAPTTLDPLVVQVEDENGQMQPVDWCGSDLVVSSKLNTLPSAKLECILRNGFLLNDGPWDVLNLASIDELISDARRVEIGTARDNPLSDVVLFEGYVEAFEYGATGKGKSLRLHCKHLATLLAEEARYDVQGQRRLSKAAIEALADNPQYKPSATLYRGLSCVFNPQGVGNCRKQWLDVPVAGEDGTFFKLPIFTHSLDAEKQSWNWARVILYLLHEAREAAGQYGPFTRHEFGLVPVLRVNALGQEVWQTIEDICTEYMTDANGDDPDTHSALDSDPWGSLLLRKCHSHALDGLKWQRAWDLTMMRCGLVYCWDTYKDGDGATRSGLRVHPPTVGRRATVKLASQAYTTHDRSWTDVRGRNNAAGFSLTRDHAPCVNAQRVVGGRCQYEISTQLRPFWPQNADWDVDPSNQAAVDAAVAAVGGETWRGKYDMGGSLHTRSDYYSVGRRWAICDAAARSDLRRPWGPWSDGFGGDPSYKPYALLDLADLNCGEIGKDSGTYARGEHAVRPRRFEACQTAVGARALLPPTVRVSIDSGATWGLIEGGCRVHPLLGQVVFEAPSLADLTITIGSNSMSFAAAYVRGVLRVQVTASIDGDAALDTGLLLSPRSLSARERAGLSVKRGDALVKLRESQADPPFPDDSDPPRHKPFAGGNSIFRNSVADPDWVVQERYDALAARAEVSGYLRRSDRLRWRGVIDIPEIAAYRKQGGTETGFRPGDVVETIETESGADPRHTLHIAANDDEDGAAIAAVTWTYKAPASASESASLLTQLAIEDAAFQVELGHIA